MLTILNLKRAAAILLMICFVLPLSRCERSGTIAFVRSVVSSAPATEKGESAPAYEYKYAFQNVSADNPVSSVLTIAGFFWPLIFVFLRLQKMSRGAATAINLAELALCAGSAYMVFGITLFGTLLFGGYLAYLAVAAYALMAVVQIVVRFRRRESTGVPQTL